MVVNVNKYYKLLASTMSSCEIDMQGVRIILLNINRISTVGFYIVIKEDDMQEYMNKSKGECEHKKLLSLNIDNNIGT